MMLRSALRVRIRDGMSVVECVRASEALGCGNGHGERIGRRCFPVNLGSSFVWWGRSPFSSQELASQLHFTHCQGSTSETPFKISLHFSKE